MLNTTMKIPASTFLITPEAHQSIDAYQKEWFQWTARLGESEYKRIELISNVEQFIETAKRSLKEGFQVYCILGTPDSSFLSHLLDLRLKLDVELCTVSENPAFVKDLLCDPEIDVLRAWEAMINGNESTLLRITPEQTDFWQKYGIAYGNWLKQVNEDYSFTHPTLELTPENFFKKDDTYWINQAPIAWINNSKNMSDAAYGGAFLKPPYLKISEGNKAYSINDVDGAFWSIWDRTFSTKQPNFVEISFKDFISKLKDIEDVSATASFSLSSQREASNSEIHESSFSVAAAAGGSPIDDVFPLIESKGIFELYLERNISETTPHGGAFVLKIKNNKQNYDGFCVEVRDAKQQLIIGDFVNNGEISKADYANVDKFQFRSGELNIRFKPGLPFDIEIQHKPTSENKMAGLLIVKPLFEFPYDGLSAIIKDQSNNIIVYDDFLQNRIETKIDDISLLDLDAPLNIWWGYDS